MPLLNSFVSSVVCVGFSSERGITIDPESKENDSFFESLLQPSVLAVVTSDHAIYPQSTANDPIDISYPFMNRSPSNSFTTSTSSSDRSPPLSPTGTSFRNPKQHSIPPVLANLPMFCFPDGVRAEQQPKSERFHHIVFTQEEGKRSYALVLTFQQSFALKTNKPDDDGVYKIEDSKSVTPEPRRLSVSKIPVPIERQKSIVQPTNEPPSTTTSIEPTKTRPRKMPSSFRRPQIDIVSEPKSSNGHEQTNQQPRYTGHTTSSYMKSQSPNAVPPPTRLTRTASQNNLKVSNDNGAAAITSSNTANTATTDNDTRQRSASMALQENMTNPSSSSSVIMRKTFFLPHCIVLVSNQPYWTAMRKTILMIYDEINRGKIELYSKEYKRLIQRYAFLVCNTPVPPIPCERLSLTFNLTSNQSILIFGAPINIDRTALDLDLSSVLLTLNIGKLLEVLAAILTQQPIMFFSSNYSKLVQTLECLLYLIYPLKWPHVYVPLVPDALRDYYLEGPPGSYIMGANPLHQNTVETLGISLTCNLDDDKNVYVPKTTDLCHLPSTKLQRFINSITRYAEELKVGHSVDDTNTLNHSKHDEPHDTERETLVKINQKILKIFFNLMIDVFGDALDPIYWKINQSQISPSNTLQQNSANNRTNFNSYQKTVFNRENYLLSKTEGEELDFYRSFVETAAFQIFLEEEAKSTSSSFFKQAYELQLLSHEDKCYDIDNTETEGNNNLDDDNAENDDDEEDQSTTVSNDPICVKLPDWSSNTSVHYLDNCITLFSNALRNAQQERSPSTIDAYAYLRGCALIARNRLLDGLRDLYLIDNRNLFPYEYILTTIVSSLAEQKLLDIFLHEPYYLSAPEWKKIQKETIEQRMSIIELENSGKSYDEPNLMHSLSNTRSNHEWDYIENNLTYQQFSNYVHHSKIVLEEDTTQTLFEALLHLTDSKVAKEPKREKPPTNKVLGPSPAFGRNRSLSSNSLKDSLSLLNGTQRNDSKGDRSNHSSIQSNSTLPAMLFEYFRDMWQHTNAEKVRMLRYLPEDARKSESILKASSSPNIALKNVGFGILILTQRKLYFKHETRSSARLLTDLTNVISIDKYQHQTIFSSSKPGIKIFTSSAAASLPRENSLTTRSKWSSLEKSTNKMSIILLFKNNHDQQLWFTMISELWSGIKLAHEQYDTSILNKASKQVALMDTLTNINYSYEQLLMLDKKSTNVPNKLQQHRNEANIQMALQRLSTFTDLRKVGSYKPIPVETRNVLIRRLSPSINEPERHSVRCLAFVEQADTTHSSLWCAYGSKLKIFNVATWICDPTDIKFPSPITCMCLDARNKLWVGCLHGELYVVDTATRICRPQLASLDGEDGCQTIAFDILHNHVLTATRNSSVTIWDASNMQRLEDINLYEIYKTGYIAEDTTSADDRVIFRKTKRSLSVGRNQTRKPLHNNDPMNPSQNVMSNLNTSNESTSIVPSTNDKLQSIQIYENLLFACYHQNYLLIFILTDSNKYMYTHLISVAYKYTGSESTVIDAFYVYKKQLWVSTSSILHIFHVNNSDNVNSYNLLMKTALDDDHLVTMFGFEGYIWAGSLRGNVYVFRMDNYELLKTYTGHQDIVYCLCSMLGTYVISGSAKGDTSIAIWEHEHTTNDTAKSTLTSSAPAKTTLSRKRSLSHLSKIPVRTDSVDNV